MEDSGLRQLVDFDDEAEICPTCGNIYRVILLKEGDDWNDFGYRHCPFCGLNIDQHAR